MTDSATDAPKSIETPGVAAGAFGAWLLQMRASLAGDAGTQVPCGDCVGCCVSSYYIPVRPHEHAARAAIPSSLLVSAPGQSSGLALLGYRADGTCPMLQAGQCTIYDARPQTCRDYDCRIFAAAGIAAGGEDKAVINRRVNAWRFEYPAEADRQAHRAVLAAAAFIRDRREAFPGRRAPTAPTGIAVLAIKAYDVFVTGPGATWRSTDENRGQGEALALDSSTSSDVEIAAAIVAASREFDLQTSSPA
jgi:Fe-S-cluster containining protein